jgi:DNA-binding NarL/FixJ family response regulator
MDALDVFYRVRHQWPEFEALMATLRYVFATGSRAEALSAVNSQCTFVLRHQGFRPAGREETGGMLGSVTTSAEALQLCERHGPEILITTDQLEDSDGLLLVREAHHRWPKLPILLVMKVLSLPRLRLAVTNGARGVISDALILEGHVYQALRSVLAGKQYYDPALMKLLADQDLGWNPKLSEKQLLILQQVVYGLTDRQISGELSIPYDTVRHHLKQAYRELGTTSRSHASLLLIEHGLLRKPKLPVVPLSDSGL